MFGPEDEAFEVEEFDLDAVAWVRGVDYVAGWREAKDAAARLGDALAAAGVEGRLRAVSAPDGSGVVRLELSPRHAREVAALVDVARLGKAS
ncbi:hypothetical protein [Streptomyces albireticuli]|uniref:Uncharacterized protein n=1 Tax=Streptomyces albireticuli TaxID=1940 RepID=A0A2A2D011_9ACTN|nr:hypothetical protein [Streptomyces albireticuli]MCD9144758.1 hypothetical protein [Streptomyces albireticuli]MCD9165506.1 hypothetical protein [Streptomyces albireticuli]MCD9193665.1 hypothetical protein [Streptomyces albireticuli]PAU45798.1 hypothetical protein CK936_27515 [Streptomyces albireticuli]